MRYSASARLLDYYRRLTHAADTHLNPRIPVEARSGVFSDRGAAVSWLESERTNLIAVITLAARTGRDDHVRDLAQALTFFFNLRKHWDEWKTTGGFALDAARRLGDQ